ncbi:MAG: hypothetical protein HPY53_01230 [Brevinematales bacterium]|nr:hypothetical protein [Brevinematales bacterium]
MSTVKSKTVASYSYLAGVFGKIKEWFKKTFEVKIKPNTKKNTAIPENEQASSYTEYFRENYKGITKEKAAEFSVACIANGLNPFKRDVFVMLKNEEYLLGCHYNVYLKKAVETGKLDYYRIEKESNDVYIVIIKRADQSQPFQMYFNMKDFFINTNGWKQRPVFMLQKTAFSIGFRIAFPVEMSGLPYTYEEICSIPDKAKDNGNGKDPQGTAPAPVQLPSNANAIIAQVKDILKNYPGGVFDYTVTGDNVTIRVCGNNSIFRDISSKRNDIAEMLKERGLNATVSVTLSSSSAQRKAG